MKNLSIKRIVVYRKRSIFITVIGFALLTYMVIVEDEPGLLPILILLIGLSSLIYFNIKLRRKI